jgi:hypothetical protein
MFEKILQNPLEYPGFYFRLSERPENCPEKEKKSTKLEWVLEDFFSFSGQFSGRSDKRK